ncbi:MAG: hypothetical protein M1831_003381 [Alyxoria varia]|nr:MAG: hypothetical protein M1831_003381 [Alyxoria varia]
MRTTVFFSLVGTVLRACAAEPQPSSENPTVDVSSNYDPTTYLYFKGYPYPEEPPKAQNLTIPVRSTSDPWSDELKTTKSTLEKRFGEDIPDRERLRSVTDHLGIPMEMALHNRDRPAVWLSRAGSAPVPDIVPDPDTTKWLLRYAAGRFALVQRHTAQRFSQDVRREGYMMRLTWENPFDLAWPEALRPNQVYVVDDYLDHIGPRRPTAGWWIISQQSTNPWDGVLVWARGQFAYRYTIVRDDDPRNPFRVRERREPLSGTPNQGPQRTPLGAAIVRAPVPPPPQTPASSSSNGVTVTPTGRLADNRIYTVVPLAIATFAVAIMIYLLSEYHGP